jgi:hypothetical protein
MRPTARLLSLNRHVELSEASENVVDDALLVLDVESPYSFC